MHVEVDNMSRESLVDVMMYGGLDDLSDDHIRQLRDHPELLDLIGNRETLGSRKLWSLLVIAVFLVVLSKIIAVKVVDEFDQFMLDVSVDLVFEMGAALIGSVATVIFIQHREKRQFQENLLFRSAVQKRIRAMDAAEKAADQ
ncbi:MAG: hypothetical protein CSB44_02695 [Gammaproteobacteria bacterium]|nr:MAG: hypothetical protein CSB44_02695 [Gammaproteobacteria bacterium]